jgi:hypothetical protein
MNDRFKTVLKSSTFRNEDRWQGKEPLQKGKPNWGNGKLVIQQAIEPGTYRVGAWQYADGNMSFEVTLDTQPPEVQGGGADDFK